jgi:hypothetical protein
MKICVLPWEVPIAASGSCGVWCCPNISNFCTFSLYWHVYVLGLGYFRMTLVTAQAPHITAHFVTSHRGCGGGRKRMNFIYCCWCRRSLSTMHRVLSVAMEIQFSLLSSCEIFGIVVNNNIRSVLWVCDFVIWHEKRKLLLQQQASKDIYMIRYFHP